MNISKLPSSLSRLTHLTSIIPLARTFPHFSQLTSFGTPKSMLSTIRDWMNALINIFLLFVVLFAVFAQFPPPWRQRSTIHAVLCSFRHFHFFCAICFIALCCIFSVVGNPVELAFCSTVSYMLSIYFLLSV